MNNLSQKLFKSKKVIFFTAALFAASLFWNTLKIVQRNYSLQKQVDRLNTEIAILELENQQLKYNIEYYETDEFLELAAREKFNKKAPGERVTILDARLPSVNTDTNNETTKDTYDKPSYQSNFEEWLYLLFGREPS